MHMDDTYETVREEIRKMEKDLEASNCGILKEDTYIVLRDKLVSLLAPKHGPIPWYQDIEALNLYIYAAMYGLYVYGYMEAKGKKFKKCMSKNYQDRFDDFIRDIKVKMPEMVPPLENEQKTPEKNTRFWVKHRKTGGGSVVWYLPGAPKGLVWEDQGDAFTDAEFRKIYRIGPPIHDPTDEEFK